MNSENNRNYIAPSINCIKLDNEISLILQSVPPVGPNESLNLVNGVENYSTNPFFTHNV